MRPDSLAKTQVALDSISHWLQPLHACASIHSLPAAYVRDEGPDEPFVVNMDFSADGCYLACTVETGSVTLYDLSARTRVQCFDAPSRELAHALISPDARQLVISHPGGLTALDASIGASHCEFGQEASHIPFALAGWAYVLDRQLLLIAKDNTIRFWNTQGGHSVEVMNADANKGLDLLTFSSDGSSLVLEAENEIRIWQASSLLNWTSFFRVPKYRLMDGQRSHCHAVFSSDDKRLAIRHPECGIGVYHVETQTLVRCLSWIDELDLPRNESGSLVMAFSPSGSQLAVAWTDVDRLELAMWDIETGVEISRVEADIHSFVIHSIEIVEVHQQLV